MCHKNQIKCIMGSKIPHSNAVELVQGRLPSAWEFYRMQGHSTPLLCSKAQAWAIVQVGSAQTICHSCHHVPLPGFLPSGKEAFLGRGQTGCWSHPVLGLICPHHYCCCSPTNPLTPSYPAISHKMQCFHHGQGPYTSSCMRTLACVLAPGLATTMPSWCFMVSQ